MSFYSLISLSQSILLLLQIIVVFIGKEFVATIVPLKITAQEVTLTYTHFTIH